MKNIAKLLFSTLILAAFITGCKKDENRLSYSGGTPPVLTATSTNTIFLSFATTANPAVTFNWTNPDYRFSTGISSQDVNYILEIDTTGANFTNPNRQSVAISKDLTRGFTQGQFNDYLLNQLNLKPSVPHNIEIRVTSTIGSGAVPLYSNVLKFVVTPFAIPPKVTPPSTGKLYITGSATPSSWQCACGETENLVQKFNQVTPTLYVLPSITLTGGGSYLFLPQYGSWSAKYGFTGANNANNVNGDDFKAEGGDILAPAATGNYKIEVDFQRGKFTVTKL